jgi:Pentapeptide repeats (8 copies)
MKPESGSSPAGEPEPRRGQRLWTVIAALPYVIPVALLLSLVIAIILVAIGGYMYKWGWTGFAGKTLWDWMKLLIVPLILAVGGLLITQMERLNCARAQELDRERLEVDRQQTQAQLRQTEQRLELDRERAEQERRLTQEGQITDRFTRAIDQLGATDVEGRRVLEVRTGAVYALERISRESPKDYGPITEILTAYVRVYAPWPPYVDRTPEAPKVPDADIQAILTLLGRRVEDHLFGQYRIPLDLYSTDLTGADLERADLESVDLHQANLHQANLQGANLRGANLRETSLEEAELREADMEEALLDGAILNGANLQGARLCSAEGITNEELDQQAFSLDGATMPNGQKYEGWLLSQGRGENG